MATATATPEVFVRKSSGLVRVMSPSSAFIYNVLTMGLIFPWTYLWAPGALPGGQLVWGILLLLAVELHAGIGQRFDDAGVLKLSRKIEMLRPAQRPWPVV